MTTFKSKISAENIETKNKNFNSKKIGLDYSQKKLDADSIILGQAKYTDDLTDRNTLIIKILRSPYASAEIKNIDTSQALKIDGIVDIYTYEDVPKSRFTLAGQSYPEASAYDRLILDKELRYVGDPVCLVVGKNEKACNQALKRIKVVYDIKEPVLDYKTAQDHQNIIHDKDGTFFKLPQKVSGCDITRNLTADFERSFGEDPEEVFSKCDHVIERTYECQAQAHCMMETYRSYAYMDQWNRLTVVSSTQVPFHIKRQLAIALDIPASRIRIIKPRVGGGFGGKQSSVTETYAGFVTLMTGRASKIVLSRKETFAATNTRHAMELTVKMGASKEGRIEAIDMTVLSDQGAYGEHSYTTLNAVGEKSLPLYNKVRSVRFRGKAVYTNKVPGGAFRGYGATQGIYALECCVNEMAKELDMDPIELRLLNISGEGETTLAYGKTINSSKLKECILKGREMIRWDEKYPSYTAKEGKIRSIGMAIAMQGSGIANIDSASAEIRLNETGDYTLLMSDTDCGTGSDTILTQMAAEELGCEIEKITPITADTDTTPFDPGCYASSGTYVTGNAVKNACENLKENILNEASERYSVSLEKLTLSEENIYHEDSLLCTVAEMAAELTKGVNGKLLNGIGSFGSSISPSPYMAGFVETELDPLTGEVKVIDYKAVIDCGTVINKNLAVVQTEGGIMQGIGFALYEEVRYDDKGKLLTRDFSSYNLPTRKESTSIETAFEESYEPTGPYGAKSIGELVMNTPAPAITQAVYNATGAVFRKLPITSEEILLTLDEMKNKE